MKKEQKNLKLSEEDSKLYLNTNHETGLTEEEVIKRRTLFGSNVLVKAKKTNFVVSFLKALVLELMSLLLFVTGLIGLALAIYENIIGSNHFILSYVQSGVLLSIVIINALFGTIQESKSSNAIDELEKMSSPMSKVLREGKIKQIPSSEVVIGDVIIVEAGDAISADAILFSDSHLKVSEAVLTGESTEVLKDADYINLSNAPLGEQKNKIFAGTNVLNGKGYGIVCAISNNTEIGKVADLLNNNKSIITPLQLKLQKLGKVLGIFGIIITILTFIFSLLVIENVLSPNTPIVQAIQSSLLLAISLAAAAIPEGLSAIVTIVLSMGVKKISTKNVLIKKLPSVETLGSTAVVCSDKTGTLTMNKMTVVKMWTLDSNEDESATLNTNNTKKDMLIKATLCTDGTIDENPNIKLRKSSIGDPTEISILDLALKNGFSILNIKNQYKRIAEIPFDSDRKLMSTVNQIEGKTYLIVKGAPDVIFSKCKNLNLNVVSRINDKWSNNAIRVLAIAQKEIKNEIPEDLNPNDYEYDLEFIGLIGMIDPPREEVKLSIKECISAGIKPIMITGDHLNTAVAIAKDLGIIQNETKELAITGAQLDEMSDEELNQNIEKYSVYARVSPENKIRIVKAWQSKDQVVAMTGDGVNDAPALKAADIGCAMGITGTDVSKQAADMILMDDNFSSIIESVKLGRNIYQNIKRIATFLLSSNVTGVFSIVGGMFIFYLAFQVFGWGEIKSTDLLKYGFTIDLAETIAQKLNEDVKFQTTITTIQILINHMIIETLPGIALGTQMTTTNLMNRRPRSKYESIFSEGTIWKILSIGLIHGLLTICAFAFGVYIAILTNAPLLKFYYGSTAAFLTLVIGGVLKSISMSSSNLFIKNKWNECKWIYFTSLCSFAIIVLVVAIPKLSAVVAERPELSYDKYESIGISLDQFNIMIGGLSNNLNEINYLNWGIYLVGIISGILTFVCLELLKCLEIISNSEEQLKNSITEFKLIPKPESWYSKLKKMNKTK